MRYRIRHAAFSRCCLQIYEDMTLGTLGDSRGTSILLKAGSPRKAPGRGFEARLADAPPSLRIDRGRVLMG